MIETVQQLLRSRMDDDTVAMVHGERTWSWREHLAEAAALGGYVLCGINTTRRGDGLAADIERADCQLVLADANHMPLLDGVDLAGATACCGGGRPAEGYTGGHDD